MGHGVSLDLNDRRERERREGDDTGTFSFNLSARKVRMGALIALLTTAAGLFYKQSSSQEEKAQPAAYYAPSITAKDTEQDFRLHLLEEGVKDMRGDVKYLREREERRQGREEAGRRR